MPIPGNAFLKGKDRIIRIADPAGARPSVSVNSSFAWTVNGFTGTPAYKYFYGLLSADFTPGTMAQEFYLIGGSGWRDSVGTVKMGDMSCSSYLVKKVTGGTATTDIEDALSLIMEAQTNPDRELWVEEFNFLGATTGATPSYTYYCRAFTAGITGIQQGSPPDNLIQFNWTFQSRGDVYMGKRVESTQILLP